MKVENLSVTQYRIYPPDITPFRALISQLGNDAVKNLFKFRAFGINEAGEAVFQGGSIGRKDEPPIWIQSLSVNERRTILQVDGTSDDANIVYGHVIEAFSAFREGRSWEPLVLVEETNCVATLDISWEEVFSPGMVAYVTGPLMDAVATEDGTPFLKLPSARFSLGFLQSESFQRLGIALIDKVFTVEPRIDTPLSDRKYFTSSPLGTEAHVKLLKGLETSIAGRRKKR